MCMNVLSNHIVGTAVFFIIHIGISNIACIIYIESRIICHRLQPKIHFWKAERRFYNLCQRIKEVIPLCLLFFFRFPRIDLRSRQLLADALHQQSRSCFRAPLGQFTVVLFNFVDYFGVLRVEAPVRLEEDLVFQNTCAPT